MCVFRSKLTLGSVVRKQRVRGFHPLVQLYAKIQEIASADWQVLTNEKVAVTDGRIHQNMRRPIDYVDQGARVYVYTRAGRDVMIAEGCRRKFERLCHRWHVRRRAWESSLSADPPSNRMVAHFPVGRPHK